MTAREEIMDKVSDSLMCDERILSVPEKELLANLLQRAKTHASVSNGMVAATIARVAGEMVAQRASEILADSIAQRLLDQAPKSSAIRTATAVDKGSWHTEPDNSGTPVRAVYPPLPPAPAPPGPPKGSWHAEPDEPGTRGRAVFPPLPPAPAPPGPPKSSWRAEPDESGNRGRAVFPPLPPAPAPPGPPHVSGWQEQDGVARLERPEALPAHCVILEEFLAPAELDGLLQYALQRERDFQVSEVLSPTGGAVDYEHRQSRVLFDLGNYAAPIVERVQSCLPRVAPRLGREEFAISQVETQITASNDGDFFRNHNDNAHPDTAAREVTFVYFFHREPKAFSGGELRIYDTRREHGRYTPTDNYRVVVPQQNQIVFFASSLAHEITPVKCPSRAFADSRFTLNGWLRRKERRLYATA